MALTYLKSTDSLKITGKNNTIRMIKVEPMEERPLGFRLMADDTGVFFHFFEDLNTIAENGSPTGLGEILFDEQGYWIYIGAGLSVDEQEQLAEQISHFEIKTDKSGISNFFDRH
jgi:hypothetical protein